jgi:phage/plasmid-like protein (TIGR03299 family)
MPASNRRLPWKLLNHTGTLENTTARDALREAGLDWFVQGASVFAEANGQRIEMPTHQANVKIKSDGSVWPLAVVGSRYRIIQNEEMFATLDTITRNQQAQYVAAGELGGGRVVYMVMSLPEYVNIPGDPHEAYLLALTSHDGSTSLEFTTVINRLFCTNQMTSLFKLARKQDVLYTVKHTANAVLDSMRVQQALQISYDEVALYESFAKRALDINFSDARFESYISRVFPMPDGVTEVMSEEVMSRGQKIARTRATNLRERAWDSWLNKTDTMGNIRGTAFGAFQAVIETYDHLAVTDEEKRAAQTILATDVKKKVRAVELLGV